MGTVEQYREELDLILGKRRHVHDPEEIQIQLLVLIAEVLIDQLSGESIPWTE